jgi:sirohydrochlorin cobaltochelatase
MPMLAENPAIVLASYGSAYPGALTTYEQIKSAYERAFPGSLVRLAFTSQSMRLRLAENEGRRIPSPLAALAELQDQGQRDVIVQSLVQGLKSVKGKFGFEHLELGLPLLSSLEDCRATAAALAAIIDGLSENKVSGQGQSREAKEEAVLFAGHGTGHPADGLYSLMASVLAKDCCNVFLGTLEGFPGITELMPRLQRSGVKKVWLLPFLLVAGGHALKDIAGSGPKSWKSLLEREGFQVGVHLQASGENEVILKIFQQHTREAMEKRFQHKLKD